MKKLLQRRSTGEFLLPDGSWTRDLQQGMPIRSETDVPEILRRLHVPDDVDLYYSFYEEAHSDRWDFCFSLGATPSHGSQQRSSPSVALPPKDFNG